MQGHLLWNAGRSISDYLEDHASTLIQNKTVLELGAGAGLPSLVCAIRGACQVVVSDYPDIELVENLRHNISDCALLSSQSNIHAEGYVWGAPVETLIQHLRHPIDSCTETGRPDPSLQTDPFPRFDLLLLADLLFNHSEHARLLSTVRSTLSLTPTARALVFFTPYRPQLLQKDLAFFELAQTTSQDTLGGPLEVRKVLETVLEDVMFPDDSGDERLRRTVFGYEMLWRDLQP